MLDTTGTPDPTDAQSAALAFKNTSALTEGAKLNRRGRVKRQECLKTKKTVHNVIPA